MTLYRELQRIKDYEQKKKIEEITMKKLTPAERMQKTALNTGIRFDITDSKGFDNSSLSMLDELKSKGLASDEQEFSEVVANLGEQKVCYKPYLNIIIKLKL
jgi:hypothetical protein